MFGFIKIKHLSMLFIWLGFGLNCMATPVSFEQHLTQITVAQNPAIFKVYITDLNSDIGDQLNKQIKQATLVNYHKTLHKVLYLTEEKNKKKDKDLIDLVHVVTENQLGLEPVSRFWNSHLEEFDISKHSSMAFNHITRQYEEKNVQGIVTTSTTVRE